MFTDYAKLIEKIFTTRVENFAKNLVREWEKRCNGCHIVPWREVANAQKCMITHQGLCVAGHLHFTLPTFPDIADLEGNIGGFLDEGDFCKLEDFVHKIFEDILKIFPESRESFEKQIDTQNLLFIQKKLDFREPLAHGESLTHFDGYSYNRQRLPEDYKGCTSLIWLSFFVNDESCVISFIINEC